MTDHKELANQLAESGRVPWIWGMVEAEAGAICLRVFDGVPLLWCVGDDVCDAEDETALLDLANAGNRGHLLARARVLWGEPTLTIVPCTGRTGEPRWKVVRWDGASLVNVLIYNFEGEVEALVQAVLLARPLLKNEGES